MFRDNDVDQARRQGGVVPLAGGRRLLLPRVFGFCGGVVHALALLERCLRARAGRRVFLLGPVIHNDTVNDHFRALGATLLPEDRIDDVFALAGPEDTVVIPAFGVPLETVEALQRRYSPEQILDTTCRDVRAVWTFLEALDGDGWTVVIHGKPAHPETRATLSRALRRAARAIVVPSTRGADAVGRLLAGEGPVPCPAVTVHQPGAPPPPDGPVALVNQTTMLHSETMALATAVEAVCRQAGRQCRVADSVCRATQDRQDAALEVCRQGPEAVLVIGGFSSSNTAQLHRVAATAAPAYMVRNAAALAPDRVTHWLPREGRLEVTTGWLPQGWTCVGVMAGASCPARDVGEVIRWFRDVTGTPAS